MSFFKKLGKSAGDFFKKLPSQTDTFFKKTVPTIKDKVIDVANQIQDGSSRVGNYLEKGASIINKFSQGQSGLLGSGAKLVSDVLKLGSEGSKIVGGGAGGVLKLTTGDVKGAIQSGKDVIRNAKDLGLTASDTLKQGTAVASQVGKVPFV